MNLLQIVVIAAFAVCIVSFAWAMTGGFFRAVEKTPPGLRLIQITGLIFTFAHAFALIRATAMRPLPGLIALALYLFSLGAVLELHSCQPPNAVDVGVQLRPAAAPDRARAVSPSSPSVLQFVFGGLARRSRRHRADVAAGFGGGNDGDLPARGAHGRSEVSGQRLSRRLPALSRSHRNVLAAFARADFGFRHDR